MLEDPFARWNNDDLLLSDEAREAFAARYPELADFFHWPALISLFETHNAQASETRRPRRRFGLWAVGVGFVGLCLAAISPLASALLDGALAASAARILGLGAAALAMISALMGYSQVLRGRDKADWILNRFRCERIRQFHFQLLKTRAADVVAAVSNPAAKAAYLAAREDDLKAFRYAQIDQAAEMVHHLQNDTAEDRPWVFREWAKERPAPAPSPELNRFFDALADKRFGIQIRFTSLKLKPGWASPATRSALIAQTSNLLTMLLLTITLVSGAALAFDVPKDGILLLAFASATGVASAAIAAMRVVADGLQLTADTERYRWYLAAVKSLNRRFEASDPPNAIARLRDLERVTYQEMRRFIVSVARSKFVI